MANTYKITRLLMLMALLLGAVSSASAENIFEAVPSNLYIGRSGEIEFSLTNDVTIYGLQAEIILPENLAFDDSDGPAFTLSERAPKSEGFSIISNELTLQYSKIAIISDSHNAISGKSGVLLTAKVKILPGFDSDDVIVRDVILTDADNKDVEGVGGTTRIGLKPVLVESIELDTYGWSGKVGGSVTITATVFPEDATNKAVNWTSNAPSIATVDSDGTVTAVGVGDAVITATAVDGSEVRAQSMIVVDPILVSSITISEKSWNGKVGESIELTANVLPNAATNKTVTWSSDNEEVATVDEKGNVTAKAIGNANITATAGDGSGVTAECKVSVVPTPVTSISLDKTELSLTEGDNATLTVTVDPTDATDKTVKWSSSDEEIATVDAAGKVTAIAAGIATITATAGEKSASCTVMVAAKIVEVTTITLNKTELSLTEGDYYTLTATILPGNATDMSVTWSSSDKTIATVDTSGKVTAIAVGTATITATSANGKSASCTVTVTAKIVEVTAITLNKTELSLTEGASENLTATVLPENATDKTVNWSSSNEAIATVDAAGKVTAIAAGTATITATSTNDKTATCTVTVAAKIVEVTTITLNKTELSLTEGDSEPLTATVSPSDATDKTVKWSSSNTAIATVDATGKVSAVAAGTATITATSANGKTAVCTVSVTAKVIEVTAITLNKTELSLTEGENATLTATVAPENATDKTVTWTSSNIDIATVDAAGKVTAMAAGTATITATSANGKTATCTVTVTAKAPEVIAVAAITLNKTELNLTEGESETLTATVAPTDATDKSVTWTSSNVAIATVDASGKVTAIAAGTATITATSANGKTATCAVTVTAKAPEVIEVAAITLNKTELSLTEGENATLTATVAPENATDKTVTWTSSNIDIATVDAAGKVTAMTAGTATITATSANGKTATCAVTVTAKAPEVIAVAAITLNKTELNLTEGESATLTATVAPENATDKTVTWTSSNIDIATVDVTGKVTAMSAGNATITATSTNGKTATCSVTVAAKAPEVIEVAAITLDKTELNLTEGESETLTVTVAPENATDKTVTWTSSNVAIATVDASGKVTAIAAGTATITATSANGKTATCAVTVTAKAPEVIAVAAITLNKTELNLTERESETLTATVAPTDATDKSVIWTSSNVAIATVDASGKVTAIAAGTATITATSTNGKTATCTVTVTAKVIEVTAISLNTTELSLTEGENATLTVTVAPENATDKTVTWTSSNVDIATVDASGKVTAIAAGTAIITATSTNGKTATCTVTVIAKVIKVTAITLNKTELNLTERESETLTATVAPTDATDKSVIWTSSNVAIATVDASGKVTAIAAGTATITATSTNGKTATCTVTVTAKVIEVTAISLNTTELSLTEGENATLTVTVAPVDATDKTVTWSSSNTAIVTVDAAGKVTAIAAGTATITATSTNGKTATCAVTVTAKAPEVIEVAAITLDKTELSLTEEETATLTATVAPENATDKTVTWTSSNVAIATVDADGKVTAIAAGTATITATSANGKTATCTVTVTSKAPEVIEVAAITLDKTELSLTEGENATLTATVAPENATDKSVTWTSSNTAIVTVDATGKVTAIAAGTATITATSANGKTATCTVTVTAKAPEVIEVAAITLNTTELSLTEGETATLTATVAPENATDKSVTWTSSNTAIVTVDASGKVTAMSAGTATITATSINGKTATCSVTVTAKAPEVIEVAAITLNKTELKLTEGESETLTATVAPTDATDKSVSWTSSNVAVATVDADGKVTAIADGTAIITASACDGSGVYAECLVTVGTIVIAKSLVITPTSWSGNEGDSFVIETTVLPEDTSNKNLIFESSDENVATVDDEGRVVIVGEGTCVIIVSTTDCSRLTAQCVINSGSGVEAISGDVTRVDVYNMNGVMIKRACEREDVRKLTPGVYILRSGNASVKVVIR